MAHIAAATQTGAVIGTAVGGPPVAIIGAAIFGGAAIVGTATGLIIHFNKQIEKAKQFAKKLKDPKHFRESQRQITEQCIQQIKKLKLQQNLSKKDNKKDIVFFGVTSSGKSSLINTLFGTQLPVGVGVTTNQAAMVKQTEKIRIWDSVGNNSDFQFFDFDNICYFSSMNIIFILYRTTPALSEYLIKLIWQLKEGKYKVFFVRTCCDEFNNGKQHKTLDQQLESDSKILKSFGVQQPIIFAASEKGGFNNKQIKQITQ